MRRRLAPLLFALLLPMLFGFTGNKGAESEFYVGAGIGQVATPFDLDKFSEFGGTWRLKFRHFPYDDLAGWLQVGGSWTTYPQGGNLGNQIVTVNVMGGTVKNFGTFGAGFIFTGDITGFGPMLFLPSFRVRLGDHNKVQFGFGMLDEAPYWTAGGLLHFEGIVTVPFDKVWAPKLKLGGRLNAYGAGERFPLELYGGAEARLGKHVRIGVEASIGDGGVAGGEPSFTAALKIGGAVGPGVKSTERPTPRG